VIAALALVGCLLAAALLVDLLVHRGEVVVRADESEQLQSLVGGTRFDISERVGRAVRIRNSGLLPTAWRCRECWWGDALASAWRRSIPLKDNLWTLLVLLGLIVSLAIFRIFAVSHTRTLAARGALETALGLRRAIHRQAMRLGPSDLDGAEQRTAVNLFTTTTQEVESGLTEWLSNVVRAPLTALLLAVLLLLVDWRLGLQCLLPLAAVWWVIHYERSRGTTVRERAESEADSELRPLAEGLRKTRLVRTFSMEDFEHTQFQSHLERYAQETFRGRLGETWALRSSRMMTVLLIGLIVFLMSWRVLSEVAPLSFAGMWLMAAILALLVGALAGLQRLAPARQTASVAADRIYRYLLEIPEVGQAVGAKFLNPASQSIILESATYRRDGRTLLDRVDLRIPARTKTALVGLEPLTPRAVAYMLPRFIEPQSGRILFDSEDIAWATLESLRAETIYVSAEDPFFTGTVLENLTCGESRYTLQEAIDAAKLVHAHKFITALPNGYETLLGEHGEQLRPGDAFRLGLARAILRNPAVLIIEEPQVRLDEDSKALIDDAYKRIFPGRTVIFLPSRLSTIRLCDQVAFFKEGRVEAVGPHAELVRSCDPYRHWEYLNFSSLSRQTG
jgi:ABC-type multidrug transport system fused ATPase/permease subunit